MVIFTRNGAPNQHTDVQFPRFAILIFALTEAVVASAGSCKYHSLRGAVINLSVYLTDLVSILKASGHSISWVNRSLWLGQVTALAVVT